MSSAFARVLMVAVFAWLVPLACTGSAPPPAASTNTNATTTTDETSSTSAGTTSAPSDATTAAASSGATALASATASVVSPPPNKEVDYWGPCAAVSGVAKFINAHRACTSDADCTVETTIGGMPGACGIGIQKSAAAELRKKTDAAFKACSKAGIPMPMPTCPMAPAPSCNSAWCQP